MNVSELRDSEHVEGVESYQQYDFQDGEPYWKVTPRQASYDTSEGVEFLIGLNVVWEYENGDLLLRKGEIA